MLCRGAFQVLRRMSSESTNKLLPHTLDRFGGVQSSPEGLGSVQDFRDMLETSIQHWKDSGIKAVWLNLQLPAHAVWLSSALALGMKSHHCSESHITLVQWLQPHLANSLPGYGGCHVGVGGVVLSRDNKILLVQERVSFVPGLWKIPGGSVDVGESIATAVEREVLEETGVQAKFKGVLAFRQMHKFRFGQDDFYIVCLCSVEESSTLPAIKIPEHEIAACQWMDVEEYLSLENTNKYAKMIMDPIRQAVETGTCALEGTFFESPFKRIDLWMTPPKKS